MDRYLIEKYSKEMEDEKLKLDPYLIKKMGLSKRNTFISINNYFLHCIPYELSINSCKMLVVLSPKEIDFFHPYLDNKHTLHLKFRNGLYGKELKFYIWEKMVHTEILNPESNISMIEVDFIFSPNDFKELLINTFLKMKNNKAIWDNDELRKRVFTGKQIKAFDFGDYLLVKIDDKWEQKTCKIIQLNLESVKVLMEIEKNKLDTHKEHLQIKFFKKEISFHIDAKIIDHQELKELPGFNIVNLGFGFSNPLIEELSSQYQTNSIIYSSKDLIPANK